MSEPTTEARQALEMEVINATLIASSQILSCAVINRVIRRIHLANNMLGSGIAALTFSVSIFLLTWLVNILGRRPNFFGSNWYLAIPALLAGLAFFVVKVLHDGILPPNRERIAKFPAEIDGLHAIRDWFKYSFGVRRQVGFSILIGLIAVLTTRILSSSFPDLRSSLGLYIGVFLGMFAIGNGMYCVLVIPTLASATSNFRMNLFPYDPASTIALRIANAGFGKLALANGLVATLVIALIFTFRPWQGLLALQIAFAWLILGWGVVTYSFAFPNYHLAKVISREKHIQIEKLEALIGSYHTRLGDLSEQEIDKMQKIIELRDRVAKSSDTAIDFGAWRDYIGSLVLPLASFVAGIINIPALIKSLLS